MKHFVLNTAQDVTTSESTSLLIPVFRTNAFLRRIAPKKKQVDSKKRLPSSKSMD